MRSYGEEAACRTVEQAKPSLWGHLPGTYSRIAAITWVLLEKSSKGKRP